MQCIERGFNYFFIVKYFRNDNCNIEFLIIRNLRLINNFQVVLLPETEFFLKISIINIDLKNKLIIGWMDGCAREILSDV